MTGERFSSLTGHWLGMYEYEGDHAEPTPFAANLHEAAGVLVASTREPNRFIRGGPAELHADFTGTRTEFAVQFTKAYRSLSIDEIRYKGVANPRLTRIEGQWSIPPHQANWTGSFVMHRTTGTTVYLEKEATSRV